MQSRQDPVRIILADDHPILREGTKAAITGQEGLEVVGEAGNFRELASLLRTTLADVLLLDLNDMGGSALPALARIKRDHPHLAVVVFSSSIDLAREMIREGALGYVTKGEAREQIIQAIRSVASGQQFLSPYVQEFFIRFDNESRTAKFAPQELTVAKLLARGMGTVAIADELQIDRRTVQNYINALRRKTGSTERTQIAAWYQRVFEAAEP